MDAPYYPCKPIYSLRALSLFLGEPAETLLRLSKNADHMYRLVPQKKKDGSLRETFDAYESLKRVQKKLVSRMFGRVRFPAYLHGGIRDFNSPRSIFSNAGVHAGAKTVVLQDIEDFFPSIRFEYVYSIYQGFFGFEHSVAEVLARLTTKHGCVPQGACTSSYIANLVFWDVEPIVYRALAEKGVRYTRFADDMTISSAIELSNDDIGDVISRIVSMLRSKGCRQKRSKLNVRRRGQGLKKAEGFESLTVTGLTVSNFHGVGITQKERNKIRSSVKEIEIKAHMDMPWSDLEVLYQRAMGRVGRLLACKHPEGERLKNRLNTVKSFYDVSNVRETKVVMGDKFVVLDASGDVPPWMG
ncbi:reverse transcriptase family protein [Pseudomonas aeruginosa]|nr:reverse transcriptase family protein [Pseudomonas aeruginosa]MCS9766749.1 reverse transcriptase family protein [Pseudomonas aeruginosa]MCS9822735.1 reverse transcriptase family protein [Pseudomonas aeruginosa]MCT0244580.1 reverse transcriptase family protein [Pseudomonas aeruginosa]MCT0530267.1 reverse transcriptase family protein [Pseudomonas aeruginosa]